MDGGGKLLCPRDALLRGSRLSWFAQSWGPEGLPEGWGGGGAVSCGWGAALHWPSWGRVQVKERSTHARPGMRMQQCPAVPISCKHHTIILRAVLFFAWPYFVSHNLWLAWGSGGGGET